MKILVSAYSCDPTKGSEPGVGWNWVRMIARRHRLWVLTCPDGREEIEEALARDEEMAEAARFIYFPRLEIEALEKVWPPSLFWTYELWQREAYRVGAGLHARVRFDLVHAVTFATFRAPGYLWKLDAPFVWGPIGGLKNTPERLLRALGPRGMIHYAGRNVMNSIHRGLLPTPKRAFAAADALIAATGGMAQEIERCYGRESHLIPEVGPPQVRAGAINPRAPGEPLRLVWSGRHIPCKALPLLLRALAAMGGEPHWRLDILGEGRLTDKWRRAARRLGVDRQCTWHGWLPRAEALEKMRAAHVAVISSMHELSSTVTMEALALGLPVVCGDHCGMADIVTDDCGIKVPPDPPGRFIEGLAAAIRRLGTDESERRRLAEGALGRVEDFSWEKKADSLERIYREVADGKPR